MQLIVNLYLRIRLYEYMYKILCKLPTRSRPDKCLKTLGEYISKAVDNSAIQYLVSYDSDDETMTPEVIEKFKSLPASVKLFSGPPSNKIQACNRDIEKADDWDILLLISDDMECKAIGWDQRMKDEMNLYYPDTDGCLWYHDGAQNFISTLSCIGRKYYDRFNYIYHPSYKSFFCDNEYTDIAVSLNKIKQIPHMIIKHMHPSWVAGVNSDKLYAKNDGYWTEDELNYNNRKANGFK
jgi:hypothetical protein